MTSTRRLLAVAAAVAIVVVACSDTGGGDDLYSKVKDAGTIVMSTDPQYPPQSELTADGTYEGFDIDVGTEIADRLGVDIEFQTPSWDTITAGSWSGRWDFSVGSMTITSARQEVLDFSDPYYFTPAQMAASTASGITSLEGLAGKTICVGAATTYLDWLNGTLDFGTESPDTTPPDGAQATTLDTDRLCAESWKAGRQDFEGWLSSSTTVEAAIDEGLPLVEVGDPVFFEPLAVAFDKSGPDPAKMVEEVNKILDEMRSDGTLKSLSEKWFGLDLTVEQGG
ncbi:MAG TPA: transporter substrate-binding domain-containing protein [Candidatus Limnocylindrales bacterium]|nr:transporter substrate-binding domain-containing protein [Candidatus Limnocylindrales bacterium]